jgi:1-acyl-sn-glycerol-3-phosphate acyltransferase
MLKFRDPFGNNIILKKALIAIIGIITFKRLHRSNSLNIRGIENLQNLPGRNIIFVSNHQTYFIDVIAMLHVLCGLKFHQSGKGIPWYLLYPRHKTYFVSAEETMRSGIIPKILNYAGGISVKRTWREDGKDINRQVDMREFSTIGKALNYGWVITFPQGTTTPFAKGRRGTAFIIKKYRPVVIPVVISGFDIAFRKKGLGISKKGTSLEMHFKKPLPINDDQTADEILDLLMESIEQSEKFAVHNYSKQNL